MWCAGRWFQRRLGPGSLTRLRSRCRLPGYSDEDVCEKANVTILQQDDRRRVSSSAHILSAAGHSRPQQPHC